MVNWAFGFELGSGSARVGSGWRDSACLGSAKLDSSGLGSAWLEAQIGPSWLDSVRFRASAGRGPKPEMLVLL